MLSRVLVRPRRLTSCTQRAQPLLARAAHAGVSAASPATLGLGPYSGAARVPTADKIYIAMSGGVDSSTVAALLAQRFQVEGVFMNNWSATARCQESSWREVRDLCRQLGVPCRRIDLEHDYWTDVFDPMLAAYARGETPNPDLGCNHYIKFGQLVAQLRRADPDFRWLATGHYAGLDPARGLVRRAQHREKDQSYYLATVGHGVLQHVLFPLAHIAKPRVRELARELGLPAALAEKRDSTGLCFVEQQQDVGQRGFRRFLAEYLPDAPGPVVLATDPQRVVGEHRGLWTHTVGQRASVPMPQADPQTRGQWFVVAKDPTRNALLIARGTNNELLFADAVESADFQWYVDLGGDYRNLYAQYRSLQEPWKVAGVRAGADATVFEFDTPRRAIAPGQYLVAYDDDVVVGAGTITRATRTTRD